MEIKEIPIPTMPDWLKLYNTYDPEYYAPGKRVSAEEWNTLFLASVRQGNYNADTLELLIKTYLPETYLTQVDFNQFSNEMRTAYSTFTNNIQEGFIAHKTQVQAQYDTFTTQVQEDFTALTNEVNSLEERVVKAEDVAYSLNDIIQEANEYAQAANQTAIESNTFAQEAKDNASTALETANNAASVAASSNNTAQDALNTAQSAVTTANNAATQATQAVNTANAASLRAEDAIATANAAKTESAAAKNTATQAETTANASNATAESANDTASEAKRIAQNALDLVTEGQGSQVIVNGVAVDTFNADTKADLDYVDRQIAALVGAAPETLDTLEELATAFEENADVVKTLEDAIVTKVAKTDVEDFLSATSTNPVQNKVLYNPVTFADSERQKSKNLFDYTKTYGYSACSSNGDGSFNISIENFYYAEIRYKLEIKIGQPYSFSAYINSFTSSSSSQVNYSARFIYTDGTGDEAQTQALIGQRVSFTLTPAKEVDYILFRLLRTSEKVNMSGVVSDIQLEEGSAATDYQPYNGQITHNGDAPVVFAEREKNRTINLFNYKTHAGTSEVTNNQDGSFTISNLTFYYPSLILNIALKPNTKYTFAETVLEVSDSVGLEASNVAFGVVAYYTDGTYSSTPEIPIRGTGRYSGTFTTNSKTINYVEYRILRKNNSTSILNGKVTDISVCEGYNTIYYPYEGPTVHEEQLKDYLPLSGGTMTGRISFADGNVALPETDDLQFITGIESYAAGGGMVYTHRDKLKQKLLQTNGAIIKGRPYNSGDDEGLIIEKADNGFAGLCLGSPTGTRSVHYLTHDNSAVWRWSNGSSSYDISHPQKAGTIALTSDIPDVSSYVTKDSSNIINNVDGMRGRLFGNDTRSVNGAPSTYQSQASTMSMHIEFKSSDTISAPNSNEKGYVLLQTITPWEDTSGGLPSQLSYGNGLAYRTASSSNAWNSWRSIIDSTGGTISGTLNISGSINLIV